MLTTASSSASRSIASRSAYAWAAGDHARTRSTARSAAAGRGSQQPRISTRFEMSSKVGRYRRWATSPQPTIPNRIFRLAMPCMESDATARSAARSTAPAPMSARLSRPASRERSSARFVGTLDTAGVSDPRARAPTLTRGRHPADLAFLVLAFVAFAVLLCLARDMTFHSDEWNVIAVPPGGTLEGWFAPYNEHWSTVLFLVYRAINELVGLRSYIPYLAAVLLVHVIAAAGLYRLLTLVSGRTIALAGAAILLFLGNAYNDLFWGWQVGFIGSTAAGIWALAALTEPPRRGNAVAAVLLLLVALATSGIGLPFLAAAVVYELLRPERRREAAWLLIPIGAYLAWYALFGRPAISVNNNPFTVEALTSAPGFVAVSIAHAVGATFGL